METLLQDVRYGVRMLWKNPTTTLVAVLTLALGIGANTAIFGTLNGLFLRQLPVANASRLTVVAQETKGQPDASYEMSYPDYRDVRSQARGFSDVLAYNLNVVALDYRNQADTIVISYVSDNYFTALGLKPAIGRLLYGHEVEERGQEPVIVLGHDYWEKRFNGDPGIIGKQVKLNGRSTTVIGVAPGSFHGLYSIVDMQAYAPLGMRTMSIENQDFWTRRGAGSLKVLGILNPGVSLKQAQSSLDVVTRRLASQYPEDKDLAARIYPERLARPDPDPTNQTVIAGVLFMFLAGMVLLLACSNVANIILVRATSRGREMAVRAALGAARSRLVRQMITESTLLALLGGSAGMLLGAWVTRLLGSIHIDILGSRLLFNFPFDLHVFLFGMSAALATGLLVGMAPAVRSSRINLNQVLHEGSRGIVAGTGRSWLRNALVVMQVAGSLMLLVVTGLFVRSARNAEHVYLGFDPDHVLNATVDLRSLGFRREQTHRFFHELEERAQRIPGVQSASIAGSVPMGISSSSHRVYIEGRTSDEKQPVPVIRYNSVGTQYFDVMRVPLLLGRTFTEQDNEKAPLVAIVNEVMAQRFWPNLDPIGKRFSVTGPAGPFIQIVGLTKQGRYTGPAEDPTPFFYVPMPQDDEAVATIQLRTSGSPETLGPDLVRVIHSLAPSLPVLDVQSMETVLQGVNGLFLFRMAARFSGSLGLVGLLLALVGVYGVISYTAAQRTHEIGIRMALGASRGDVLKMILRQGFLMIGNGLAAGLLLTFVAARAISGLLVGVKPTDPLTLLVASAFLAGVGILASFLPARRAMRVEPLRALKYE
ncbi:MAG: ABC transporter permease [Actinomycetota bacterium]